MSAFNSLLWVLSPEDTIGALLNGVIDLGVDPYLDENRADGR